MLGKMSHVTVLVTSGYTQQESNLHFGSFKSPASAGLGYVCIGIP